MGASATLPRAYNMAVADRDGHDLQDAIRERKRALDQFFLSVERKAFRIAQLSLRHEDDALDAVQDAMLQLARAYGARPAEEWKPLFYRILENRVRDMQRRRAVRAKIMAWLPFRGGDEGEAEDDPIAQVPSPAAGPVTQLEQAEAMGALEGVLGRLPARQRQAFLLRSFEGLDVAQTAKAMGCSEGSVKTHYFRAVHALRSEMAEYAT